MEDGDYIQFSSILAAGMEESDTNPGDREWIREWEWIREGSGSGRGVDPGGEGIREGRGSGRGVDPGGEWIQEGRGWDGGKDISINF